jgi:1-deoxyxylulose-5-phosphate synthase
MRHTKLGRTGLQVSKLCLGTMTFGLQCDGTQGHAILGVVPIGSRSKTAGVI